MPGAAPAFAKAAGKPDVAALLYSLGMDGSLPRLAPFGKLRTSPFGKLRRAAMPAQGKSGSPQGTPPLPMLPAARRWLSWRRAGALVSGDLLEILPECLPKPVADQGLGARRGACVPRSLGQNETTLSAFRSRSTLADKIDAD